MLSKRNEAMLLAKVYTKEFRMFLPISVLFSWALLHWCVFGVCLCVYILKRSCIVIVICQDERLSIPLQLSWSNHIISATTIPFQLLQLLLKILQKRYNHCSKVRSGMKCQVHMDCFWLILKLIFHRHIVKMKPRDI